MVRGERYSYQLTYLNNKIDRLRTQVNNLGDSTFLESGDNVSELVNDAGYLTMGSIGGSVPVFGVNFALFQDLGVSTTNSELFGTKIYGITDNNLSIGTYRILVSYQWNHESTVSDFESRLTFDGNLVGQNGGVIHIQEPQDTAGDILGTGSGQVFSYCMAFYVQVLTERKYDVRLEYRTSNFLWRSSIWDASIEIIKVL